jgi:hypothetical protein
LWSKAFKGVEKAGEITLKSRKKHRKRTEKAPKKDKKCRNYAKNAIFNIGLFQFIESFIVGFMWVSANFHEFTGMQSLNKHQWCSIMDLKHFGEPGIKLLTAMPFAYHDLFPCIKPLLVRSA